MEDHCVTVEVHKEEPDPDTRLLPVADLYDKFDTEVGSLLVVCLTVLNDYY